MGTYNGLYRLGSFFGMLVGGTLTSMIGLQEVALLFGLLTAAGIPVIFIFVNNRLDKTTSGNSTTLLQINWLSKPVVKVILSGLLLAVLFPGLLMSTLSFVIGQHYKMGISLLGMSIGASALAGIIQAARWSWEPFLATRFGRWSDGKAACRHPQVFRKKNSLYVPCCLPRDFAPFAPRQAPRLTPYE